MEEILLINDSTTLTKVLTSHFVEKGYRVTAVSDFVSAYEAFIRKDIDLVLTDYVVDNQDGLELIDTFRSRKSAKELPVIVFTALANEQQAARSREAGVNLVLAKCHGADELVSQVQKLIDGHEEASHGFAIDHNLGRCIVKATEDVFQTMMNLDVKVGEVTVEKAKMRKAEVIGSIGVAGFLTGSISLFMPRSIAAKAVGSLMMMDPAELSDEDISDAIGEIANMVGGNIKTELFQKAPLFDISVPSVFMGDDLRRRSISDDLCFHAPFEIAGETFSVEFLMVTKKGGGTGVQSSVVDSMQTA